MCALAITITIAVATTSTSKLKTTRTCRVMHKAAHLSQRQEAVTLQFNHNYASAVSNVSDGVCDAHARAPLSSERPQESPPIMRCSWPSIRAPSCVPAPS